METPSAAENLQVIRTIMERAAIYRRTLAPIMFYVGALGMLAAGAGMLLEMSPLRQFAALWLGTAVLAIGGAFLIARKQALNDKEAFWSAPTRRVAQALAMPLAAGFAVDVAMILLAREDARWTFVVPSVLAYACAVHSAGFFVPRGMQKFAWIILSLAIAGLVILPQRVTDPNPNLDHAVMGFFFGALHLAYGFYLKATKKQPPAL
jgi:hypothetical protein